MPLLHFTERHFVRLFATETRRTDTSTYALTQSHVALGRFLAGELLEFLDLKHCDIQHPQGIRQGWKIASEHNIALVPFLRAGLYVADGAREVLQNAPMFHVSPRRGEGLNSTDLTTLEQYNPSTCVLIDSVVNTGASLEPVLEQLLSRGIRVFVVSLVCPVPTAERLEQEWPDVYFLFARISTNQYVGKGSTDTGNRLFGTAKPQGGVSL